MGYPPDDFRDNYLRRNWRPYRQKIIEKARGWIEEVRRTGESKIVNLNAADRWTVHHLAGEYSDIETHSEGEGRDRQLIISQKSS